MNNNHIDFLYFQKLLEESKSEEKKMAELYRDFTTELENKIEVSIT